MTNKMKISALYGRKLYGGRSRSRPLNKGDHEFLRKSRCLIEQRYDKSIDEIETVYKQIIRSYGDKISGGEGEGIDGDLRLMPQEAYKESKKHKKIPFLGKHMHPFEVKAAPALCLKEPILIKYPAIKKVEYRRR